MGPAGTQRGVAVGLLLRQLILDLCVGGNDGRHGLASETRDLGELTDRRAGIMRNTNHVVANPNFLRSPLSTKPARSPVMSSPATLPFPRLRSAPVTTHPRRTPNPGGVIDD